MLWILFIGLLTIWLLGVINSWTLGAFMNVLLLFSVVALVFQLITSRQMPS
jgi:hypothetical protein